MTSDVFIHPRAIVEPGATIGPRTRIWAHAHVLPGARIGADCNICDGVFVEGDVVIGDRVTVKCGVQLWDGLRVEDDAFIGPNATFTNDPFPRSAPESFLKTIVRTGARVGANATVLPGVVIGSQAMVGAGAVVTRDVPEGVVVVGNPARIVGRVAEASGKPASHCDGDGRAIADFLATATRQAVLDVGRGGNEGFAALLGDASNQRMLLCLRGRVEVVVQHSSGASQRRLDGDEWGCWIPRGFAARIDAPSDDLRLAVMVAEARD